jgi:hypothetical protein
MDAEALAWAVDDRINDLPPDRAPARLFAVEVQGPDVRLTLLWSGFARELPPDVVPPAGSDAIAIESSGWAAPMDEGRPSRHPKRRRMHNTTVIFGDMDDVSVLRCEGSEPQVLRGVVGIVPDLLIACWLRRPVSP